MKTNSVNILGSTGSIGTQALEVCRRHNIRVNGISAKRNVKLIEKQIREFSPKICHMYEDEAGKELAVRVSDTNTKVIYGEKNLCELAAADGADTLLNAVMGSVGIAPTMRAIEKGMKIALANKETLVAAGKLITDAVRKNNVFLIPVDSEHSAIFQSLMGNNKKSLKKILLTASGGPFLGKTKKELESVTCEDALNHPNWSMGKKITIDSATMMNKGLEIIEARWLFDTENIEVVVQRESIIHSMVEYADNSIIAQLGTPSMKIPIQFAFTYPERYECNVASVDFAALGSLTLAAPDYDTFGCLKLAQSAMKAGGSMPLVMNAANEVAVDCFLNGKLSFLQIEDVIGEIMSIYSAEELKTLEDCLERDKEVRIKTIEYIGKEK